MIDYEMREIVDNLNTLGLATNYSCQGNHRDGRILIAYISFSEGINLPVHLMEYIKSQKWQIDRDYSDSCDGKRVIYSIYSVGTDFPKDFVELKKRNTAFIEGWKNFLATKQEV